MSLAGSKNLERRREADAGVEAKERAECERKESGSGISRVSRIKRTNAGKVKEKTWKKESSRSLASSSN